MSVPQFGELLAVVITKLRSRFGTDGFCVHVGFARLQGKIVALAEYQPTRPLATKSRRPERQKLSLRVETASVCAGWYGRCGAGPLPPSACPSSVPGPADTVCPAAMRSTLWPIHSPNRMRAKR